MSHTKYHDSPVEPSENNHIPLIQCLPLAFADRALTHHDILLRVLLEPERLARLGSGILYRQLFLGLSLCIGGLLFLVRFGVGVLQAVRSTRQGRAEKTHNECKNSPGTRYTA